MIRNIVSESSAIGSDDIDAEKIILMKHHNGKYALLTRSPDEKWFFTDLFKGDNMWPGIYNADPHVVVGAFVDGNELYQFDTKGEFIQWLFDNV